MLAYVMGADDTGVSTCTVYTKGVADAHTDQATYFLSFDMAVSSTGALGSNIL